MLYARTRLPALLVPKEECCLVQPVEHEEIPHGLLAEPRLNLRQAVPCIGVEAAAALLRVQRPSPGRHTTGFLSGRAIVSASV